MTALEGSHLFLSIILTGNQQPFQANRLARGKDKKGKSRRAQEYGDIWLCHMLPKVFVRGQAPKATVFCPAFSFKPTRQEEGAFPCKPSSYLGWLPVPLEPLSFVGLQHSNSSRTMAKRRCVHTALPARPAPALLGTYSVWSEPWLHKHILWSDNKSFHWLGAVLKEKCTGIFSCLLHKSCLKRPSKSSLHVGTPTKSCVWLNPQ